MLNTAMKAADARGKRERLLEGLLGEQHDLLEDVVKIAEAATRSATAALAFRRGSVSLDHVKGIEAHVTQTLHFTQRAKERMHRIVAIEAEIAAHDKAVRP